MKIPRYKPGKLNRINVLDYPTIQSAFDAAVPYSTVVFPYIPEGYNLNQPIFIEKSKVKIKGKNNVGVNRSFVGDSFIVGLNRNNSVQGYPTNAHWVDSFGIMDNTYSAAPSQRFGIKTIDQSIFYINPPNQENFSLSINKITNDSSTAVSTPTIPFNATAKQVQDALNSIGFLNNSAVCSGGPLPNPVTYNITLPQYKNAQISFSNNSIVSGQTVKPYFQASSLNHKPGGTRWGDLTNFSFDYCGFSPTWSSCNVNTDANGNPQVQGATFFSIDSNQYLNPNPITLIFTPSLNSTTGNCCLIFTMADQTLSRYCQGKTYFVNFPIDQTSSLLKISGEIDFNAGTVNIWVNTKPANLSGDLTGLAGNRFVENECYPLRLGGDADITIFGLRFGSKQKYTTINGIQARLDGQPINDSNRYLVYDNDSTNLNFQDKPGSFTISYNSPIDGLVGYGLMMPTKSGDGDVSDHISIESFTFNSRMGMGISVGRTLNFSVKNCTFNGGHYGLGNLPLASNYPWNIEKCDFIYQSDACIYNYYSFGQATNLFFAYTGRVCWIAHGNTLNSDGVFVAPGTTLENVVKVLSFGNPGGSNFRNWNVDYEGFCPSDSYFYLESSLYFPSMYNFSGMTLGSISKNINYFKLRDFRGRSQPLNPSDVNAYTQSVIKIDGITVLTSDSDNGILVDAGSSNWTGEIRGVSGTPHAFSQGLGSVVSYHNLSSMPTTGSWSKGKHIIFNTTNATTYVCTTDGNYNSGNAPVWATVSQTSSISTN